MKGTNVWEIHAELKLDKCFIVSTSQENNFSEAWFKDWKTTYTNENIWYMIKYDRNWCQRMIWTSFKKCNSSLAHSPLPPKYRQSLHTSSTRSLQYYIYYKLREANQTSSYFGALFTACICGTTTARLHIQFILYICCLFIYCAMTIKS